MITMIIMSMIDLDFKSIAMSRFTYGRSTAAFTLSQRKSSEGSAIINPLHYPPSHDDLVGHPHIHHQPAFSPVDELLPFLILILILLFSIVIVMIVFIFVLILTCSPASFPSCHNSASAFSTSNSSTPPQGFHLHIPSLSSPPTNHLHCHHPQPCHQRELGPRREGRHGDDAKQVSLTLMRMHTGIAGGSSRVPI